MFKRIIIIINNNNDNDNDNNKNVILYEPKRGQKINGLQYLRLFFLQRLYQTYLPHFKISFHIC